MIKKLKELLTKYDFVLVTASTVTCSALNFFFSVFAKRYVNTTDYGIYSTCLLFQSYFMYAQMGVLNSYIRDYPQALGRKDYDDAKKMRNITFTYLIAIYSILLLIIDGVVLFINHGHIFNNYYSFGYFAVPIILLVKLVDDASVDTIRIEGHYNLSALYGFLRTTISVVIAMVAVRYIGYYALYLAPFLSSLLSVIFNKRYGIQRWKPLMDFKYLKTMIYYGFPQTFQSLVWTLVTSVDKIVILAFMTTEALGEYSVSTMGFTTLVIIPQTIGLVFYNKISKLYGETGDTDILIKRAASYTGIVATITGGACLAVFYFLPAFVKYFMPNFVAGTVAAQIIVIGVAIYSTTIIFGNVFSVLKLNTILVVNSLILLAFNISFSVGLVFICGKTIENVAFGTAISYALYSFMMLLRIKSKFGYSVMQLFKASWVPLLVVVVPGLLFYFLIPSFVVATILSVCMVLISYAYIWFKRKKKEESF